MVNLAFAIYDRTGADGNTLVMADDGVPGPDYPKNNADLWAGFGGPCEARNDGDPIVLYDQLANRWLMSQLALPNFPRGPFYQCIAVSQTSDPTGSWHRYEFAIPGGVLNDYPKFGVWSDGYYMAINQFKCNVVSCRWAGQGAIAFERDVMLAGGIARMVYFNLASEADLGGMLPADVDGLAPPIGAPNLFAQVDEADWGDAAVDQLQIWEFAVDWANPTASTFTHTADLATEPFNANLCNYVRNCIPQPPGVGPLGVYESVPVDAISDRLMFRLQYRNFGGHQTSWPITPSTPTVPIEPESAGTSCATRREVAGKSVSRAPMRGRRMIPTIAGWAASP